MSRLEKCLSKFGDSPDAVALQTLLDQGVPERAAVRQVFESIENEIDELVGRIEASGGTVSRTSPLPPDAVEQQSESSARAEDELWSNWQPERTKGGVIRGAPQWVNDAKDRDAALLELEQHLAERIKEGDVGRYWYEESARAVLRMMQGDVVATEKFIQLLAIYSPQASVQVNTYFAIKAWNHWQSGVTREQWVEALAPKEHPLRVKTGEQDLKAIGVLYDGVPFAGRKTDSFYLNLMHDVVEQNPGAVDKLSLDRELIESLNKPATIDLWMYRAFGNENEAAGDDKGTGAYSFAENFVRRLTARMNLTLQPGQPRWTPHQVQAAVWSAMKARYEIPEVKEKTWVESIEKGYAFINDKGKRAAPTTAAKKREHNKIWRKHALAVTSEDATDAANISSASFSTFIEQATEVVTWEALPSADLNLELFNASPEVKRLFTEESKRLLVSEDGADLLAEQLGVPIAFITRGAGGYGGNVNPNNLSHLVPTKGSGEFSTTEVTTYAQALQYIYKQDAVPWFRADPRALSSKAAQEEQKFRVVNLKTGRVVPKSKVDTLAEAQAIAAQKGAGFEVRGGKYARGVALRFDHDLSKGDAQAVLDLLGGVLGDSAGFTQTAPNELSLINFRDDDSGIPFVDDQVWSDAIDSIGNQLQALGMIEGTDFWSEGKYGNVHNWQKDPGGQTLLEKGGLAGRPDLHAWLRGRRDAFDAIIERYSGDNLARREAEAVELGQLYQTAPTGPDSGRGAQNGARLPVRSDGRVPLTHWGRTPGLTSLDPGFHGQGAAGGERRRAGANFLPRTYYGLPGYNVQGDPGVLQGAATTYFTTVAPGELYDLRLDPDGLYNQILERKRTESKYPQIVPVVETNELEQAIKAAGYKGYWADNPQLGPVVAAFEPLDVTEVGKQSAAMWGDEGAGMLYQQEERAPGGVAPFDTSFDHEVVALSDIRGADGAHAPERAVEFLRETAQGLREPRRPPSVRRDADGKFTVLDGRSGTTAALLMGYTHIPVRVIDKIVYKDKDTKEEYIPTLDDPVMQARLDELYLLNARFKDKFDKRVEKIAKAIGGGSLLPGLKGRDSAVRKIKDKYVPKGGTPDNMSDLLRGTLALPDVASAKEAHDRVMEAFNYEDDKLKIEVVKVEDPLLRGESNSMGYTDIKYNFRMTDLSSGDSAVVELQLNVKEMLLAKESWGHALYEQVRDLKAGDPLIAQYEAASSAYYTVALDMNRSTPDVGFDAQMEHLRVEWDGILSGYPDLASSASKALTSSRNWDLDFLKPLFSGEYGDGMGVNPPLPYQNPPYEPGGDTAGMPSSSQNDQSSGISSADENGNSSLNRITSGDSISQTELNQGATKGGYQPLAQGNLIRLFNAADLSTFMHEAGHLFLQLELQGAATEDTARILAFLGAKSVDDVLVRPGETISAEKRARHEKFARTFEAYLFEGKAPSVELRPVFSRMAAWLKQVYRSLQGFLSRSDVELNDEIRGVFDRMLATDAQIAQAEIEGQYAQDFFQDAASAGMTTTEWEDYQKRKARATDRANETLQAKLLRQFRRNTERWWKQELNIEKARAMDNLADEPVYAAQIFLRGPVRADHSNRLNTDMVRELFGDKIPAKLRGLTHKDSDLNPDNLAAELGFADGYTMLKTIISAPSRSEMATTMANERMVLKHGDILNDGTLEEEAREAAHNVERGKLILMEFRILNRKTGKPGIDRDALKAHAKRVIENTPMRELRPDKYHRAEVRAAQAAATALAAGDMQAARDAKLQQAANFYLWREANRVKQRRDSIRRQLAAMQRRSYKPSKVAPEYIRQLKVYLASYDFRQSVPKDRERAKAHLLRVANWVKRQTSETSEVVTLDKNLDGILRAEEDGTLPDFTLTNYRDMTLAELQAVYDQAKHLRFVGGQKADSVQARKSQYHAQLADTILDNFKDRAEPKEGSFSDRFAKGLKAFGASVLLHADAVLRYLDRYQDNGPLYTAIKRRIDDAVTQVQLPMQEKAGEDIAALYSKYYSDRELRDMNKREDIAGHSMSTWEKIAMALNWGNEGGRKALLASIKNGKIEWTESSVAQVLGTLEKRDWDFVQEVWDYIGTYKQQLFELERKRNGVVPPEVEAVDVKTKFGTYRGGYYPLKYDPEASIKVSEEQTSELMKNMMLGRFANARVRDGMLQERKGSGGRPVWLDMMVFHRHVNEVINLIALSEPITEVQEILNSKAVKDAMTATGNQELWKGLDLWLKDTATGEVIHGDFMSRSLRHARTGFTTAKLAWNFGTILMQPLGVFQSIPVVGAGNMLKGMLQLARNPVGKNSIIRQVQERSPFMRERSGTFNKDIRDTLDKLNGDPNKPGFLPTWVRQSFFAGIVFTQRYVDVATWLAAYEKGKASDPDATEADLVYLADRAVARSQASGIWSDRTPVERGTVTPSIRGEEWVRIWTALGSYFFAKGNLAIEIASRTNPRSAKDNARFVADMLVLFTVEALVVALIRGQWPDDDEEDKTVAGLAATETLKSMFGTVPIVRELVSAASGFQGGGVIGAVAGEFGDVVTQINQGEVDSALIKSLNDLGGIAFKYPSSATGRFVDSLVKDIEGEDVEMLDYLMWREKD